MGFIKAVVDSAGGTLGDQWLEIIIPGEFNEHTVVSPGVIVNKNRRRGANTRASNGVISNGSKVFIPKNVAAFSICEGRIEDIIYRPGEYTFQNGVNSLLNGNGFTASVSNEFANRFRYGGISSRQILFAFVNMREIRNIKFGTKGPLLYNDLFYNTDLEIYAYGTFSLQVVNPVLFIRNFVPPNVISYSFDDLNVRGQLLAELRHSLGVAINSLSNQCRISQLPSMADEIANRIRMDNNNAGTWEKRFGIKILQVCMENIEFTDGSRELVNAYSKTAMEMKAYSNISAQTSNIAAQQKIASGIRDNGFGNSAGVIMGVNYAQTMGNNFQQNQNNSIDSINKQMEVLSKLKELLDTGILTQEEFNTKKKEILNL